MTARPAAGMLVIAIPRPQHTPAPDVLKLAALTLISLTDLTVGAIEKAG